MATPLATLPYTDESSIHSKTCAVFDAYTRIHTDEEWQEEAEAENRIIIRTSLNLEEYRIIHGYGLLRFNYTLTSGARASR
ncbi:hypothetical protein U1Q18_051810, partial [Sarracenia purpurea var. burkii]